ncbi:histidine--tRNA ligase, putative [Plasmodium sp. gorilla clade G2]|uniref:histidine--tRNA ligase, putative n=1 Tax=Plasmodium sp. gorilla clade G2 TaxID=880535 RepID=UPI000D20B933|nr:histidine--tRNA ligase, putative [Plasmodium sp. gorilla clade G2]SOV19395.1 histidine--tRNA ligase, putative [Plasmodium sp. gorilla clade G2]
MSISIYKSKIFNSKDIVDISIHEKKLKVEPSSFKDCFYRLNDKRINIEELENKIEYQLTNNEINNNYNNNSIKKEYIVEKDQNDGKCNKKKTNVIDLSLDNNLNDNIHLTYKNLEEIKCLYFFFLINILRFKNNLDLNVIRSICTHINNISNNDKNNNQNNILINNIKEHSLYSLTLKDFFLSVLKNCGKNEYNLNDFNRSIHIVIEKSSVIFLNTYKIVSSCKYLTCCFANLLEVFNLNYDILFMNSFNNNINNSNIKSINNIVSNLKWMLHDSKIEKNSTLSKNFSSNILLYVYTQSKLIDECEYFMNVINQNFKNSIESFTYEYNEEMKSIHTYINILCNNMNQTFYIYLNNLLNMCKNIMPLYIEKLNEFLLSEEKIINHNENFKTPPVDGIILVNTEKDEHENKGDIKSNLVKIYEKNILDKIEFMFKQISEQIQKSNLLNYDIICNKKEENDNSHKNEYTLCNNNSPVDVLKKLNCVFINISHLITDIILHLNILNDIRAYNKAIAQHMKQKKVSSCVHNVGVGCNEFKNFLYSFLSSENSLLLNESYINKEKKLVTSQFYDFLEKYFSPYKYEEELNEILLPKNINFNLKTAKGCKDFTGEDMQLRNIFFEYIKKKFLLHGAVEIDTPIFELKETLMNKYGEDSKLIFDLKDQGGESLSLRYDLTVPLYRFINTNNISHLKRFHIGKVYRRDEPSMNRGRFREFYQCDFDIVGKFDTLRTDFHILYIFWDILYNLRNVLGNFKCKLNHRKILEYMLLSCNIHKDKVKTVSSSIDKLDKITFQQFRDELLNDKGIHIEAIDKIEQYISKTLSLSPFLVIEFLRNDLNESTLNEEYKLQVQNCINHLEQIFDLLKHFNMLNQFSFDLSLARGLDYYTGIIFEFVLLSETNVGSVAAGGRYDFLIRNKRREYLPSVGASIGIERIITIAEEYIKKQNLFCKTKDEATNKDNKTNQNGENCKNGQNDKNDKNKKEQNISNKEIKPNKSKSNSNNNNNSNNNENSNKLNMKDSAVDVLVCNIKKDCFKEIVELCTKLWANDISTEFIYVKDQKIQKQLVYALEKQIPLVLIIGDEIEQGIVKLREITLDKEKSTGEKEININDCIQEIKKYFTHNFKWKQNITNMLFEKKQ